MAYSDDSDWSSSFNILKMCILFKFSVNCIIIIISHDLINVYAKMYKYESFYNYTHILLAIYII